MAMHKSMFDYLRPTDAQLAQMDVLRAKMAAYAGELDEVLPDGPDKTYIMRKLREVSMWVNVCITRQPDGTPRS